MTRTKIVMQKNLPRDRRADQMAPKHTNPLARSNPGAVKPQLIECFYRQFIYKLLFLKLTNFIFSGTIAKITAENITCKNSLP